MVDYAPLRCKRVARGLLKRKIRLFYKWMIARRGKGFAGIF